MLRSSLANWYSQLIELKADPRKQNVQFERSFLRNLGSRPKDEARFAELARGCILEAIETSVHLMCHGSNERVRGTAAQVLLDRRWDKLKVEVLADGASSDIEALRLINEQITTDETAN